MKKCIICHTNKPTIPDRNKYPSKRKEICSECHTARLQNDFIDVLEIERKRRERV